MGVKVSGVEELIAQLSQIGKKADRGVADELRRGAEEIAQLAREQAPVDEGNLEDAIKAEEDRSGINGRIQTYVYVDSNHPAEDGKTVGDYAEFMHEGSYQPGPLSVAKARGNGRIVGRKFLERAVDELKPEIVKRVASRLKRDIG